MKLEKKRALASRALNVGQKRIVFNQQRLNDVKEAITKQDIKDLKDSGAIVVAEKKGRKAIKKRKTRRRAGSIKNKTKTKKQDYMTLTRKLRAYVSNLKSRDKISRDEYYKLRKEIRAKNFRSLAHMKEQIKSMRKEE